MGRIKRQLLFDKDGGYMGETNTLIGIRRKAAQLGYGDERMWPRIILTEDEDGTRFAWRVLVAGSTLLLICQPEDHPDVYSVPQTKRRVD